MCTCNAEMCLEIPIANLKSRNTDLARHFTPLFLDYARLRKPTSLVTGCFVVIVYFVV